MHSDLLTGIAHEYPQELIQHQLTDKDRISFLLSLIPMGATVCDLGGGTSMFSAACKAAVANRVVVIDDFGDPWNRQFGDAVLKPHRKAGVEFVSRDIVSQGIADYVNAFDVITCICSIEHWHASPKTVLHQCMRALVPGGRLIIGLPNAMNLRKRLSWLLGTGSWTSMESWYEQPEFRSHVREPSVADLHYIARDIGLTDYTIYGRNWAGFLSPNRYRRIAAQILDRALRLRPTLCSDLYLVGHRPKARPLERSA
jgi:SAM-dependent methyltransferase